MKGGERGSSFFVFLRCLLLYVLLHYPVKEQGNFKKQFSEPWRHGSMNASCVPTPSCKTRVYIMKKVKNTLGAHKVILTTHIPKFELA